MSKVILVTGANASIGLEVVRLLATQGHTVYLGARNEKAGLGAIETLKSGGVSARYVHLDVTDSKSIVSAKDIIEKAEGHLDSLVNNAGVAFFEKPQKATEVGTAAVVREACNVNLFGLIETTTVFLPLLLASKSTPSIVNITTGMASNTWMANNEVPNDFLRGVAYNSSKAGANSFTISLAHELRGKAVVTALTPGFTTTKLNHFHPGGKTPREAAEGIVPWALENDASKTGLFIGSDGKEFPW